MTYHEEAWVEDNSPYESGLYATHLVIAGIVNPDHDYEVSVVIEKLAKRCHCSERTLQRHLSRMMEDGFLALLDAGGGRGRPARYRFLKPRQNVTLSDLKGDKPGAERVTNQVSHLLLEKEERKDASAVRLCLLLGQLPETQRQACGEVMCEGLWKKLGIADRDAL